MMCLKEPVGSFFFSYNSLIITAVPSVQSSSEQSFDVLLMIQINDSPFSVERIGNAAFSTVNPQPSQKFYLIQIYFILFILN